MKVVVRPPIDHPPSHFRDAIGHLDPRYAADLQARSRAGAEPADPVAFRDEDLRDDAFAEELGETFLRTATGGEDHQEQEEAAEQAVAEEMGGARVETTGEGAPASDTNAFDPEDASPERLPRS